MTFNGRFVKITGTKLRGTDIDGYMLQLGEVEVYGTPYLDRNFANSAIDLFLGNGGDKNSQSLKAVKDALENELTTQKELDILIQTMYDEAGITDGEAAIEPEEEQTAAEYEFEYFSAPGSETDTVTDAETEKDTAPDITDPETKPTENDNGDKTLKTGLIIGGAIAAAALIAAGVIFVIKKRKK